MELKTFVAEALRQIVDGVTEAQSGEHGRFINAQGGFRSGEGNLFVSSTGAMTRVDFDVAVSAETTGGGKG